MWEAIVANSKRLYNWATNPTVETVKEYYDKTSPLIQQAYDQQTSGQNSSPEVNAIAGIAAIGEVASIGGATQGPNPGPAGENLAKLAGQVSLDAQARRHGVPGGWQGLMDQLNRPRNFYSVNSDF